MFYKVTSFIWFLHNFNYIINSIIIYMPKFVNKWGESNSVPVTKPKFQKQSTWYQMNGGNSNLNNEIIFAITLSYFLF